MDHKWARHGDLAVCDINIILWAGSEARITATRNGDQNVARIRSIQTEAQVTLPSER